MRLKRHLAVALVTLVVMQGWAHAGITWTAQNRYVKYGYHFVPSNTYSWIYQQFSSDLGTFSVNAGPPTGWDPEQLSTLTPAGADAVGFARNGYYFSGLNSATQGFTQSHFEATFLEDTTEAYSLTFHLIELGTTIHLYGPGGAHFAHTPNYTALNYNFGGTLTPGVWTIIADATAEGAPIGALAHDYDIHFNAPALAPEPTSTVGLLMAGLACLCRRSRGALRIHRSRWK